MQSIYNIKMSEAFQNTIDIEAILKSRLGDKTKFVPGFLVSWLKRTIHQDQVNAFLWESRHLTGTEWLTECVKYLDLLAEDVRGVIVTLTPAVSHDVVSILQVPLYGPGGWDSRVSLHISISCLTQSLRLCL